MLTKEEKTEAKAEGYKGVWIFGEQRAGKIQGVVYELLGAGRTDLVMSLFHVWCRKVAGYIYI